jgi:acyl-coenzyme A synthetase/AMP-(fatty) acid ligase
VDRGLPQIAAPFAATLSRHGDAPALVTRDGVLSYRELAAHVDDVARGLGEERRLVLVAGANDVDAIVTYLAALVAGHPVLLVPGDSPPALRALVDAYDPDVVAGPHAGTWRLEERREGSLHELHPELALLLSTSGSTGSPKLVRLSHENVRSNAEAIADYLQIRGTDRAATTLPMHYCYGLSVVNSHLVRGAALVLTDRSVVDPCFWDLFRRERATSFAGVPYTFELLDRVGFADMDLPHLRYVTQAGGRLAPERVARYAALGRTRGWDLFVMYGQTEATARIAYLPPDLAASHPHAIGIPIPGGTLELEPLPECEDPDAGELVYAGPNVMLGYAQTPADLALGRVVDVLRTGDVARHTSAGLYEVIGRRSRFAKVLGLRIDLDRAEALLADRGLSSCCVGQDDELIVAVEGREPDGDAGSVRRLVSAELGAPAGAVRVHPVAELPRLACGKPDHRAVAELARIAEEQAALDEPQANGSDVRALFAEVLDEPDVSDDDTFVSLGGDSLSYVEMSVRLEEALGHLPAGWHLTPIRELVPVARPRRLLAHAVETSVVLRALAILLIVATHAHAIRILGGAHLLVAVAGFNFARFQLGPAPRLERLRSQLTSVARIAVPTVAWIAVAALLLADEYGFANVVLLNAVVGPETWTAQWHFWFVEVLLYILLALAALLAVPWIDRAERRSPWLFAATLVGLGLLGRFHVFDAGIPNTRPVLWLFALGWAAARSSATWQRVGVTSVVLATVPGFFGDAGREALIAGGILLLLWTQAVPCPAGVRRVVAVLASSSLYIYLTHWQVYPPLADMPLLAVAASIGAGVLYWKLATRASAAGRRWWTGAGVAPARTEASAARPPPARARAPPPPPRLPTA